MDLTPCKHRCKDKRSCSHACCKRDLPPNGSRDAPITEEKMELEGKDDALGPMAIFVTPDKLKENVNSLTPAQKRSLLQELNESDEPPARVE